MALPILSFILYIETLECTSTPCLNETTCFEGTNRGKKQNGTCLVSLSYIYGSAIVIIIIIIIIYSLYRNLGVYQCPVS